MVQRRGQYLQILRRHYFLNLLFSTTANTTTTPVLRATPHIRGLSRHSRIRLSTLPYPLVRPRLCTPAMLYNYKLSNRVPESRAARQPRLKCTLLRSPEALKHLPRRTPVSLDDCYPFKHCDGCERPADVQGQVILEETIIDPHRRPPRARCARTLRWGV